jgi:methionyl-tRNA formyltransferase
MRIVFFGTPDYVLPVLELLHKRFRSQRGEMPIVAVVTQKPKATGRRQELTYSAVDNWAHKRNVPVFYSAANLLIDKVSADVGIIASYGNLLPKEITNYFLGGILVIHPSLLPKFRWGSPVPAAIVTGTNPTGVTIIKMDEKFDHGPIISQFEEEVLPDDDAQSLKERLFAKSAPVLAELLKPYLAGKIKPKPQDNSQATFARMLTKEDGFIPPEYLNSTLQGASLNFRWKIPFIKPDLEVEVTPEALERYVRAMDPWPGAWTYVKITQDSKLNTKKRLKILKAHVEEKEVLSFQSSVLCLDEVQLEGKNKVSWKQFCKAYPSAAFKEE